MQPSVNTRYDPAFSCYSIDRLMALMAPQLSKKQLRRVIEVLEHQADVNDPPGENVVSLQAKRAPAAWEMQVRLGREARALATFLRAEIEDRKRGR